MFWVGIFRFLLKSCRRSPGLVSPDPHPTLSSISTTCTHDLWDLVPFLVPSLVPSTLCSHAASSCCAVPCIPKEDVSTRCSSWPGRRGTASSWEFSAHHGEIPLCKSSPIAMSPAFPLGRRAAPSSAPLWGSFLQPGVKADLVQITLVHLQLLFDSH